MKIKIQQPLAYSEIGGKPNQEDSIFPLLGEATKETRVFIVCDGMGGHEKGEVASDCVAKTIGGIMEGKPLYDTAEMKITFKNALKQAYENLDKLDNSQSQRKMGTTLTFMALCSDGIFVAHIGDRAHADARLSPGRLPSVTSLAFVCRNSSCRFLSNHSRTLAWTLAIRHLSCIHLPQFLLSLFVES